MFVYVLLIEMGCQHTGKCSTLDVTNIQRKNVFFTINEDINNSEYNNNKNNLETIFNTKEYKGLNKNKLIDNSE